MSAMRVKRMTLLMASALGAVCMRRRRHEPRRYPEGVGLYVRSQQPFIVGERAAKKAARRASFEAQSLVQN
jgi:hypothetical protein